MTVGKQLSMFEPHVFSMWVRKKMANAHCNTEGSRPNGHLHTQSIYCGKFWNKAGKFFYNDCCTNLQGCQLGWYVSSLFYGASMQKQLFYSRTIYMDDYNTEGIVEQQVYSGFTGGCWWCRLF